jgi:hypothetical protein
MMKKWARILITLFAVAMATQVLYGQIICDLMVSMPCCMGDMSPKAPMTPSSTCDHCLVLAPPAAGNFVLESKYTPDRSDSALFSLHAELQTGVISFSSAESFGLEAIDPSILPTSSTPEILSVFRI